MEQVPSFDQATLETWITNLKSVADSWYSDAQQQAKQRQGLQDKINDQYLRFVEANSTLVLRNADAGSLVANRIANNGATLDHLVSAGEIDTTAQGALGAKTAEEFRSVAKQAVEAAIAAIPGTSAASQGTTGVAQGAIQTGVPIELAQVLANSNTLQTALLAELAKIEQSLSVILAKVTGAAVG